MPSESRKSLTGIFAAIVLLLMSTQHACERDYDRSSASGSTSMTIATIMPSSGSNAEEVSVTIRGTNFPAGAQVLIGGAECGSVEVLTNNIITAVVPAEIAAGLYDVIIVSGTGANAVLSEAYTVIDPTDIRVDSISPNSCYDDTDTDVVISGANFVAPVVAALGDTSLTGVSVVDSTTINAAVPALSSSMEPGVYDLIVTNSDESQTTFVGAFEVVSADALRIDSVDPVSATNEDDVNLTIYGANFTSPMAVYLGEVQLTEAIVQGADRVVATAPAGFTPGVYDVTVENSDGETDTLASAFTVTESADDDTDDDTGDDDTGDDDTADDDSTDDDTSADDDTTA